MKAVAKKVAKTLLFAMRRSKVYLNTSLEDRQFKHSILYHNEPFLEQAVLYSHSIASTQWDLLQNLAWLKKYCPTHVYGHSGRQSGQMRRNFIPSAKMWGVLLHGFYLILIATYVG